MKCVLPLTLTLVASASAFVPAENSGRVTVARDALADKIFGMDLFEPVKDQNTFGARNKKNLALGKLTEKSYIPAGLSKEQYEKIRLEEKTKREKKYSEKAKSAFKYTDFTEWYAKRGTDLSQGWKKAVTLGHTMAKTKYDWSGEADVTKKFESTNTDGFLAAFSKKPAPAKKAAPAKKPVKKSFF